MLESFGGPVIVPKKPAPVKDAIFEGPLEAMQEINYHIPFKAIGSLKRLQQIRGVGLKGEVVFVKSGQVNTVEFYWEGIDRYKYEESHKVFLSRVLLVSESAWYTGRDETTTRLEGDGLDFYQSFNYPLILSNLIPFMTERFDIQKEGKKVAVHEEECFVLKISQRDRKELRMFFSDKEGLLKKVEFKGKFLMPNLEFSPVETAVELFFADYKEADGVKHWRRCEQWRDGTKYTELFIKEVTLATNTNVGKFLIPGFEADVRKALDQDTKTRDAMHTIEQAMWEGNSDKAQATLEALVEIVPKDARRLRAGFARFLEAATHKAAELSNQDRHEDAKRLLNQVQKAQQAMASVLAKLELVDLSKDLQSSRAEVTKAQERENGYVAYAQANSLVDKAKAILKIPNAGLAQAKRAMGFLDGARECYKQAARVPGLVADEKRRAHAEELRKARQLVTPLLLDPVDAETIADWTGSATKVEQVLDQKISPYVRARQDRASLISDAKPFPAMYELKITLGLVNRDGKYVNKEWHNTPELFVLRLLPANATDSPLDIRIGKVAVSFDPSGISEVQVNKKALSAASLETDADWSEIVIRRTKTSQELVINGGRTVSLPRVQFKQAIIHVRNRLDQSGTPRAYTCIREITLTAKE